MTSQKGIYKLYYKPFTEAALYNMIIANTLYSVMLKGIGRAGSSWGFITDGSVKVHSEDDPTSLSKDDHTSDSQRNDHPLHWASGS